MVLAAALALGRSMLGRGVGAALCLGLLAAGAPAAAEPAIAVIVARGPAAAAPLSQTLVLGIFGRKRLLWPDRSPILPVNLPASHPLRRNFSLWVFDKTPEDLQDYWNDQYFHGVLPPPVLASEEAVIRFVASTPGAIGYVSACSVDRRVEVVALIQGTEPAAACPR
jgi:hypothetical protein